MKSHQQRNDSSVAIARNGGANSPLLMKEVLLYVIIAKTITKKNVAITE